MTTLLLDASVVLAAFDRDDDHHQSANALVDPGITLATLDLVRYEVANVAVRAWRAPRMVTPLLAAVERIADDVAPVLEPIRSVYRGARRRSGKTLREGSKVRGVLLHDLLKAGRRRLAGVNGYLDLHVSTGPCATAAHYHR